MSIPKIIHQLWIGPKQAPTEWMQTWKLKNPDYHYICWNEERLCQLDTFSCQEPLNNMKEINGVADIYRWEILYTYGGYFFDADSICIHSLTDDFQSFSAFACYENEIVRQGLVATGAMGFPPKHPLVNYIIQLMKQPDYQDTIKNLKAWQSVGPGILTTAIAKCPELSISILPSYLFYPKHHTGIMSTGYYKIYGYQYWCTNFQTYNSEMSLIENMNTELIELQAIPTDWVSIIIPCHNTKIEYIIECLQSIQMQTSAILGIELIWINDGSTSENTATQIYLLKQFESTSKHIRVVYLDNISQQGCRNSLRKAVQHCTCELIFKMDSDDIMASNRLDIQYRFMKAHPTLALCGGQITCFHDDKDSPGLTTQHPLEMTWGEFLIFKPEWFMNHPTFCFRREALLSVDNYPQQQLPLLDLVENMMDDYEIILRILKKYHIVMNMPETLVFYRIHSAQMTQKFSNHNNEMIEYRTRLLKTYT